MVFLFFFCFFFSPPSFLFFVFSFLPGLWGVGGPFLSLIPAPCQTASDTTFLSSLLARAQNRRCHPHPNTIFLRFFGRGLAHKLAARRPEPGSGPPPVHNISYYWLWGTGQLEKFFWEAESDPKCIAQALLAVKRDIVDTYCHASGAFCHNRTKQSPIPISWRESKAERQRTAKQSS